MRKIVYFGGKRFYRVVPNIVLGIMFAIITMTLIGFSSAVSVLSPKQQVVVIDAGHGGYDPGAIAEGKIYEKDINLEVALVLKNELIGKGVRVIMTREQDTDYLALAAKTKKQTDLDARIQFIEQATADVCISLHVNSVPGRSMSGAETFYQEGNEQQQVLAEKIQEQLRLIRNMKQRAAKAGDFYLTKNLSIPTVIVEMGYLSNPGERAMLRQPGYQQQLAKAISNGTVDFLNLKKP